MAKSVRKSTAKKSAAKAKPAAKSGGFKSDFSKDALSAFVPGRVMWTKMVDESWNKSDPHRVIINVATFAPGTGPDTTELEKSDNKDAYQVTDAPRDVIAGMREGGSYKAVNGWGFKDKEDWMAKGSPIGSGSTRLEDMEAA